MDVVEAIRSERRIQDEEGMQEKCLVLQGALMEVMTRELRVPTRRQYFRSGRDAGLC